MGTECSCPPDAGVGQGPRGGDGDRGADLRGWQLRRQQRRGERGCPGWSKARGCEGLRWTRPHLQLRLQARSFAQERGHHVVCDGELVWNLRAAADHAGVDAVEVLVPKEAVLCPVLGHVFWEDGAERHDAARSPPGTERHGATARDRGRLWTPQGKMRPPASPEGPRATFPNMPPGGALTQLATPASGSPAPPTQLPRPEGPASWTVLPPEIAGLPESHSDAPPPTGDGRLVGRENFLNVLQSLPRPFAVHEASEFEPQRP